jgi:sulfopyruvate decarboxylase subunit alpha
VSEVGEDVKLDGGAILAAIKAAGVRTVAALPDITTSAGLLWPLSRDTDLRLIRVCKEDEGISICSALSYCNHRAVMSMQQTGLFDSLNAVRSFAVEYKHPVCMLVGLLGKEAGLPVAQSKKYSVRIVEPVLRAMEIDHLVIERDDEIPKITAAIETAYATSRPVVVLFGTRVRP